MGCALNIKSTIIELFNASQPTAAVHQKNSILLKGLYDRSDHETFLEALKQPLNAMLFADFKNRNAFVERIVEFFAEFCGLFKPIIDGDDVLEHCLLNDIFNYLLETSECMSDVVRYRSCQIINKILDCLVGSEVSSGLCDKLKESMLIRLQDPKTVIRLQAITSLYRLQDPDDPEDDIISKFVTLMNRDASAKIRKLCVERVAVRKDVISAIITKIRDVDVGVRLSAHKRLCKFAEHLKISDKRLILTCGATDSSENVKKIVKSNLISAWLEHYNDNILELMKSVRFDATEKDVEETVDHYEFILSAIFSQKDYRSLSDVLISKFDENKILPLDDLNWETVAYWRIYVQHLLNKDLDEQLEMIQPDFVDFCRYIKQFYSNVPSDLTTNQFLERQFIIKQFFLMTKMYDLDDPARRRFLNALVPDALEKAELMFDVTRVIISNLDCTIPNISSRCRFVNEIISNIMYPTYSEEAEKAEEERELELAKLKLKLNCLVNDQNNAIKNEEYMDADRLKHEIEDVRTVLNNLKNTPNEPDQPEKRTDIPTIIKYLDIACSLLLSADVTELIPPLRSLKSNVIHEMLIHDNDAVRAKAFHCYCLCCLVDKTDARTGIHIFSTPILAYSSGEECDTQILLVCIAAVVDLLRIYGSNLLAEPTGDASDSTDEEKQEVFTGGTSLTDLIRGLVQLLNDEDPEIQLKAAMGLCKLILSERFQSSTLVARLILKWCIPVSHELQTNGLQYVIGVALQRIPLLPSSADQLEDVVLIVVKALISAPNNSPLAGVNVENIAKFMLALCASSSEGRRIHTNLAIAILLEMKTSKKSKLNLIYSKMLLMLRLSENAMALRDILALCDIVRDNIPEKMTLKNIVKFVARINEKSIRIESVAEENEDEES